MYPPHPQEKSGSIPEILTSISAVFAIVVSVLVLVGWTADIDFLKRILPGLVSMNPATAVAFILAGLSLWLQRGVMPDPMSTSNPPIRRIAWMAALIVTVIGVFKLGTYLAGWDAGIDRVFFSKKLPLDNPDFPNRMAPNTALNFALLGGALILLDSRSRRKYYPAELLALTVSLISFLALLGYAYQVRWLYGVATFIPMALHTAATFLLLAFGIFGARPTRGMMALITADSPGGLLARRMLPAAIITFAALGWLYLEGERRSIFETELGVTIYTTANITFFGALIWWSAHSLHKADAELRRRAALLEEVNQELEAFSYSVSHDLRAPLRHIQGFAELLTSSAGSTLPETGQRHLKTINDAAVQMGLLIDNLLDFSRMGRVDLHQGRCSLNELVRETVEGLEGETRDRNINWKIDSLPDVIGDPVLLRQVLVNLVGNAVKYSRRRDSAEIEIGCAGREEGRVILVVRDNGAGFDMRYAHKLFGVFQRLHRPDEFEGTGIGLATVRRIVVRHGGRTWAEGEPDQGASFYVTLALAEKRGVSSE